MKKLFALLLALATTAALMVPAAAARFTDVAADAYYADAVNWAVDNAVTEGTTATTFEPDAPCTNAQILTFIWRANGRLPGVTDYSETGLELGRYYTPAVRWALDAGIIDNVPFEPYKLCTRAMAMEYLWRLGGCRTAFLAQGRFTDVTPDDPHATAIAWALEKGITTGSKNSTFAPDDVCTRAQIVTFLNRAMAE